jgi:segregation and condensation protein A
VAEQLLHLADVRPTVEQVRRVRVPQRVRRDVAGDAGAYKLAAAYLAELERSGARRHGRDVELEPRFAQLLPDVLLTITPADFAALAAGALAPKPVPTVSIEHVHNVRVSVREHMAILRTKLRRAGSATFRSLVADCGSTLEVVARFLGLLELYREALVGFDQAAPLAELQVRWTGPEDEDDDAVLGADTVEEEYG